MHARLPWPFTFAVFLLLLTGAAVGCTDDGDGDDETDTKADAGSTSDKKDAGAADTDAATGRNDAGGADAGGAESVSAMITAKGGTLKTADGSLELVVPAGAVADDVMITVAKASDGSIGYVFGPDGQKFDKPVEVTLTVSVKDLQAIADKAKIDIKLGPTAALVIPVVSVSDGKMEGVAHQSWDVTQGHGEAVWKGEIEHFSSLQLDTDLRTVVSGNFGLFGKVGESKAGTISIYHGESVSPADEILIVAVPYANCSPLTDKVSVVATKPKSETDPWKTKTTCLGQYNGVGFANVNVRFPSLESIFFGGEPVVGVSIGGGEMHCQESTSTCAPSGAKPSAAPTLDIGPSLTRCRLSFINVDATHMQGTNCFEIGGVEFSAECTSPQYCQLQVPADAADGDSTVKTTTQAGSAETTETFLILDVTAAQITEYSPDPIHPGDTVTVTGTGFLHMSGVDFLNGANPPFTPTISDKTDTSFTFIAPSVGDYSVYTIGSSDCGVQINPAGAPHLVVVTP